MTKAPSITGEQFADVLRYAEGLNVAVAELRAATGLTVQLHVNGAEYGDRVGVRVEGDLLDPYLKVEVVK